MYGLRATWLGLGLGLGSGLGLDRHRVIHARLARHLFLCRGQHVYVRRRQLLASNPVRMISPCISISHYISISIPISP